MASAAVISYGEALAPRIISPTRDGLTSTGFPAPAATTLSYSDWRRNCSRSKASSAAFCWTASCEYARREVTTSLGGGGITRKALTLLGGLPALTFSSRVGAAGAVTVYVSPLKAGRPAGRVVCAPRCGSIPTVASVV